MLKPVGNQAPIQAIVAILMTGWMLFWLGTFWQNSLVGSFIDWGALVQLILPGALIVLLRAFVVRHPDWRGPVKRILESHTEAIAAIPASQAPLWIALAAGLCIYTELVMIRLHASYFQLFAYFKNVSLLSCFLGLGIGFATGSVRPLASALFLPLLTIQVALLHSFRFVTAAPNLQNPVPENLTFGMWQAGEVSHFLAVFGFLILIFTFNALCFIPLGQLASHLMMRIPKLRSYNWNLLGSLLGVLLFCVVSFAWAPPSIWFFFLSLMMTAFLYRTAGALLPATLAVTVLLALLGMPFTASQVDLYSPYQILTLIVKGDAPPELQVNNVYYQKILDLSRNIQANDENTKQRATHYSLPYHFKPGAMDVLIVGSGTGNDVAAAVRHGVSRIDAVEIDPAILRLGKSLHPEFPYSSRNVSAIVDDARSFIRRTAKKYDLIVYGLLDSHTLLSSMSGVRLDSFVYTVEAFREARSRLKEGGIISLSFSIITPALGSKLFLMLQEAFDGRKPVVLQTGYDGAFAFVIGDEFIREPASLPAPLREVTSTFDSGSFRADKATDDWPFFYMPVRKYPLSYLSIILVMLYLSRVFVRVLVPGSFRGFSMPCFFLGAGFMLVETKGITELALLFGSTWMVISVVISAILVLAYLANLLVMKIGTPQRAVVYGLLLASLIVGLWVSSLRLNPLDPWLSRTLMTLALTLPLFFAGLAFSGELDRAGSLPTALSSNLLGSMLGGFLEYNSMYFGFRSLYVLAFLLYGLAFYASLRSKRQITATRVASL